MDTLNLRQRILLNQPHIASVSGDIANFTTDMKAPLKECKVYFEPVQEGEGDPSPDNVRPISGWTEMEIQHTKENLFDPNEYLLADATKVEDAEYPDTYTGNKYRFYYLHGDASANLSATGLIPMKPYGQLTISYYKYYTPSDRIYFHYTDAEAWVNHTGNITTEGYKSYTSVSNRICDGVALDTSQGSTATFKIGALQINVGDKATEYEPYQGQTIPINWQTEDTVYGGSLDVLSGVLTVEWVSKILDGSDDEVWTMSTIQRFYTNFPNCIYLRTSNKNIRSDRLKSVSASSLGTASINVCYTNGTGSVGVRIDDTIDSVNALRTWLAENPVQIVQKVTPITYQLTPQQLLTFKGENNIWSNTNGQTEVKFWTH